MTSASTCWPRREGLVLGTALWGWGVAKADAFSMLDEFAAWGGTWIDTATNYPINGVPDDRGVALAWIGEWLHSNPQSGVQVWTKVGSIDNSGSQAHNLSASAIYASEESIREIVVDALGCIAVHWDHRQDRDAIADTVSALRALASKGLAVGLSGIERPDLYALTAPDLASQWWIQVRENVATSAARTQMQRSLPSARYVAYGINLGGRLLRSPGSYRSSSSLRGLDPVSMETLGALAEFGRSTTPEAESVPQLALLHTACNSSLDGAVIGPRTIAQVLATLRWWDVVCENLDEVTRTSLDGLLLPIQP
ncbi:MAG: aldo/keto reductase [Nocardioides sp.]|nr:aldo/keto reductase [Nocardioides sp.]